MAVERPGRDRLGREPSGKIEVVERSRHPKLCRQRQPKLGTAGDRLADLGHAREEPQRLIALSKGDARLGKRTEHVDLVPTIRELPLTSPRRYRLHILACRLATSRQDPHAYRAERGQVEDLVRIGERSLDLARHSQGRIPSARPGKRCCLLCLDADHRHLIPASP